MNRAFIDRVLQEYVITTPVYRYAVRFKTGSENRVQVVRIRLAKVGKPAMLISENWEVVHEAVLQKTLG